MTEPETRYQRITREQSERQAARALREAVRRKGERHFRRRKYRETQFEMQARLVYDHDRDFDLPGDDLPEKPQF